LCPHVSVQIVSAPRPTNLLQLSAALPPRDNVYDRYLKGNYWCWNESTFDKNKIKLCIGTFCFYVFCFQRKYNSKLQPARRRLLRKLCFQSSSIDVFQCDINVDMEWHTYYG